MTTLHPEFYRKLLAVYDGLRNDQRESQLSQNDLERYDTLVIKRHLLRLVRQGDLGRPAQELSPGRRGADDTIEKELERIDQDLHCTLSDCMPDFHAVHKSWFSRSQARELYKADCAYRNQLKPFAIFLGIFMLIGIMSLFAMMP